MKKIAISFMIAMSLLMAGCAASPKRESAGEYIDSSATTARVKAHLVDALGTRGFSVVVKTFKDEVQLSGFVDNNEIRRQAAIAASQVQGVKSVRNNIVLK